MEWLKDQVSYLTLRGGSPTRRVAGAGGPRDVAHGLAAKGHERSRERSEMPGASLSIPAAVSMDPFILPGAVIVGRTRFLLLLDSLLFAGALVLQVVRLTGLTIHEWIGLAIGVPLLVHLVLQWQWISATWRRAVRDQRRRAQFNLLLNGLLFVFMTLAIFSGVLASEVVTPDLRLSAGRVAIWSDLHSFTTNTLVGLVGLHVALNWRWIVGAARLHVLRPLGSRTALSGPGELTTEPEDGA